MRKIAVEEHFTTRSLLDALRQRDLVRVNNTGKPGDPAIDGLLDLGAGEGARFIETAPISEADRAKICHANAERLLGIPER